MNDFAYAAPTSLAEATKLLQESSGSVKILSGGTDIIVQLREGAREADLVVDVKKLPELQELNFSATHGLRLGAAVPCAQVYDDTRIAAAYPALVDAAKIIGGWQIQSRASIGGNLCNSSPAADSIPALIAHHAYCEIVGPAGKRNVPVEQFCTGPGKNVLQKGELLVALVFPPDLSHCSSAYERFIPRNEMDIAVVGCGSRVQLNAACDTIEFARIGLGAVAATPKYAQEASEWLAGKPANEDSYTQAGELAKKVATPISDMRGTAEYRTHLVGVLVKRTLTTAVERAKSFKNP
ncbi:FAD binding domain-containing protein [Anatilimnocola floriformis]|uniref:FAD binding domain-containing protein n=1 Tax=Anatilimnocola floriformis TaxID=2948575 RepID=UPI0020C404C4|nr:xanthine dehydrogenase family protein subunit M [Anatilimnocola floriformis]